MFRQAKYNKSDIDVVEKLWNLLSQIVGKPNTSKPVVATKLFFLKNLKYKSLHFYSLPEDMSYGSRELLIAFSYLLANNLLNNLVRNVIKDSPMNPNFQSDTKVKNYNKSFSFDLKEFKSDEEYENAMMWMEGRMKINNKASSEYKINMKKLASKISSTSKALSETPLSHLQIMALNDRKNGMEYLESTDYSFKVIQSHEKWQKQQHLFWEWMNTVLAEKQKEERDHDHPINTEELDKLINTINEA